MDDNAIVALYWQRDQQAIVETERKYGTFCRGIARNILTISEDAEECVNDTWHHAWNAMPPQRPAVLRAFLGRIVRNLSLDRWRRSRAQKRDVALVMLLDELEQCIPDGGSAEQAVETRELVRLLNDWLLTLKPDDRILFVRRYWFACGVKEIAAAAGLSAAQASRRLYKLRAALRTKLQQEGVSI